MTDSRELLAEYVRNHSESAFRELVGGHINLVYSTALRLVDGDAHKAEDVAQIVFTDLAKMAGGLAPNMTLGGWLHRHTCFVSANAMRGERRRQARERKAVEMNSLQKESSDADFSRLAPLLDETINQLDEPDRVAILLRFFEQKDFRAIGESLESSEDAARMRVNRALEKLRGMLTQRGIRTPAAAFSIAITANAVQAAPVGLAASISTSAFAASAISSSTAIATATKAVTMTALQKTLIAATVAALTGAGIYEARQNSQLREQIRSSKGQQALLTEQIQQLQRERDGATNRLAALLAERSQKNPDPDKAELLKLRGEVTQLKTAETQNAKTPTEYTAATLADRVAQLKRRFEEWPGKKTPEVKLLTEQQWLLVASGHQLQSADDFRDAMSELRTGAIQKFAGLVPDAMKHYTEVNDGQIPSSPSQLAQYLALPWELANSILDGYEMAKPGEVHPPHPGLNASDVEKWAMLQKDGPADPDFDHTFVLYSGGWYYYGPNQAIVINNTASHSGSNR